MPSSPVNGTAPNLGDNKGIKFQIKTGGKTWACTLQDRAHYERTKEKTGSPTESTTSSSSASTKSS
ncbi:hypothetical protein PT974_01065 [Cladobotryum mycophilum]|uniref:Uncharacterized protein n=1 Tax=Cladobotryum mycophilum TaxID=491253 RepID=A0ABR0T2L1_9HYPO